jgi:hypothetical protein
MKATSAVLVIALVSVGTAAKAAPRGHNALDDAQRLSRKGDHAGAARLLEKARTADPKSAQLLSELGWQWFLAQDLPHALEATNDALAASTTPALKAAALYNLGRINEALGKQNDAVNYYVASLSHRSSKAVLSRLSGLDPKKAAELDPDRPTLLDGPFPSVATWCARLRDGKCDASLKDAESMIQGPHDVAGVRPPYQAVLTFVVHREEDSSEGDCAIAVRLASGWYARRVVRDCREGGMFRNPESHLLEVVPLAAGQGPIIRWTLHINIAERNDQMEWVDKEPERHTITCGIGLSEKPSCGEPHSEGPISFP